MVSGGSDAAISIFELETLTCTRSITDLDHLVRALSLSADAGHVAYCVEGTPGVCIDNVLTGKSESQHLIAKLHAAVAVFGFRV